MLISPKYFTESNREKELFLSQIQTNSKIVITFHQNPDGDALGSALGLKFFLKNSGCENIQLISPTDIAEYIKWMPEAGEVKVYDAESCNPLIEQADLIFCLDFSAADRLKEMTKPVLDSKALKIIVDHHENPENFADLYFWNVNASSTCELVFTFIEQLGQSELIDLNSATCLYTGLLTDTGSFRFNSTTPKVHQIAAFLLEKGVNPSEVNRKLFDNNPYEKIKFLGHALSQKLTLLPEFRTAFMAISTDELKEFNSRPGDTEGLVNYGLGIENVALSVLFTERDEQIRISFRSIHDFSVADFARKHFEGGGHKNAAGGRSNLSLDKTIEKFITLLPEIKNSLLEQPK